MYLNGIIEYIYFGKNINCESENSLAMVIKNERLQIHHTVLSLTFDIVCGLDGKNLELTVFSWTDCVDKKLDVVFIILSIDDCTFIVYSNTLINCNYV